MWSESGPDQERRIAPTLGGNWAFHNWHNDYAHILDPNDRRRLALAEIDKVPFGWYHIRAIAVAGIGFFTDSYDIFAINFAVTMLGLAFYLENGGIMPSNISLGLKVATSSGAVLGQIGFGLLADVFGRRTMYGVELLTILVTTVTQSLASHSKAMNLSGLLVFWRVAMGIGVGGDYPMSAVITSEFAPTRWRGTMMASVFSMQGAGQFVAALVALLVTVAFKSSFVSVQSQKDCDEMCQLAADRSWRIIIGAGGIPALFALYYRITIPETPRYTFDVAQDIEKAHADIKAFTSGKREGRPDALTRQRAIIISSPSLSQPRGSVKDFLAYFGTWRNGSLLFATTASWFLLDLAFYGLGLNTSVTLTVVGYGPSTESLYKTLFNSAVANLIIVTAGSLPGYWLSVSLMDSLGRRPIQIGGFAILTIIFCIIGFCYSSLSGGSILALYILAQLFFNFGPNATTFIVPGECFPTRYRSTGHGLSAASGKLGAIIAQFITQSLLEKGAPADCASADCWPWFPHLMKIFASFMFCGTLISFLVPETKLRTLEVIAGEHEPASSNGTQTSGRKNLFGFLNPVLGPTASPKLRPKSRDGKMGRSHKKRGGRSFDEEMDADIYVPDDGNIFFGHMRDNSNDHGNQRIDGVPLNDVGGLLRNSTR